MDKFSLPSNLKISAKQMEWIQLGLGGLLVFISAVMAADPIRTGLGLWFGSLWIYLAWYYKFSPVAVSVLVYMALRGPASAGVPDVWFLAVNLGLSSFSLALSLQNRITALVTAALWTSILWLSAPLVLLVFAGFPRMGKLFEDDRKWFVLPALLSGLGAMGYHFSQGLFPQLMQHAMDVETYVQIQETFLGLFTVESLWCFLPLVGIFEITQKKPDDHRMSWRNLVLVGALSSLIFVPVGPAFQMLYLVGLPLSVIMILRWSYVLPDLFSRSVFWVGLWILALPFLQGGIR